MVNRTFHYYYLLFIYLQRPFSNQPVGVTDRWSLIGGGVEAARCTHHATLPVGVRLHQSKASSPHALLPLLCLPVPSDTRRVQG